MNAPTSGTTLRIGVSSCLLGEGVRYDGGHKRDDFLTRQLAPHVEFVPVCPEVELGLGVPRPTLRLVGAEGDVRLVEPKSGRDHTAAMRRFARQRVRGLRALDLSGYVLKRDSPSCGMERVKLYGEGGMPRRTGTGLFAEALLEALPDLPVEEEGRLRDADLRENFVERVFAYRRLADLFATRWTPGAVVAFHTAHKLQLMSHSPQAYRDLGRLVAGVKRAPRAAFRDRYRGAFMAALSRRATRGRHANVLQHMAGTVSAELDPASRAELAELIHDFRVGHLPLLAPLAVVRHHARRLEVEYLLGQRYLDPHPRELMLRNHV